MKKNLLSPGGKLLLFCILFFQYFTATAQVVAKKIKASTGQTFAFLQAKPTTHDASPATRKYPVIIFLHGGGALQSNDTSLTPAYPTPGYAPVWNLNGWGPIREVGWQSNNLRATWNNKTDTFIVLQPLGPVTSTWPIPYIDAMIKYGTDSLKADTNRIYLSGHSWGGAGVFNYLNSSSGNAKKLAAVAPISAWNIGLHTNGPNYVSAAKLPVWGFHAYDDATTKRDTTIYSINRLNAVNPQVRPLLTIWPAGVVMPHPHNSAPEYVFAIHQYPYLEDGVLNIYEWFLGQNNDSLPNILPVARAGNDTTISATSGVVSLNGSASTDADGNIVRYVWRKISGPAGGTIANPFGTTSSTTVSELTTAGVYQYQLNVVDHRAAIARDTIKITVVNDPVGSGKAVAFSSTTGARIIAGNVTELKNSTAFTVEAYFKYDSTVTDWSNTEATIFRNYISSTDMIKLNVYKPTRSIHFTIANGTNAKGYTSSNVVSHGTWYHVAAVFEGAGTSNASRAKVYINGVLQALTFTDTIPTAISGSTPSVIFGGEPSASRLIAIDEVRLWDTVVAAGTINFWKDKLLGNCHPNVNHLALYWPLDDDSDPTKAAAALGASYNNSPIFYGNYVNSTVATDTATCSGKAVAFSSTTGARIIAGNVTELKNSTAFTVEAYFKYDSTVTDWSNTEATIFRDYISSTDMIKLNVYKPTRSIHFTVANGTSAKGYTSSNVVSHDTWYHVAAVFEGAGATNANRVKIYINGVLQALTFTDTIPTAISGSTPVCIFGGEPSASRLTAIDEVRLWDTVLAAGTIGDWKDRLLGDCHPNFNHLALYYPLDNDANPASAAAGLGTSYSSPIFYATYVVSNRAAAPSDCEEEEMSLSSSREEIKAPEGLKAHTPVTGKLYPNPTDGPVQIELNASSVLNAVKVNVIDMYGKYIYRNKTPFVKNNNSISLNIASLPSGTYIIEVGDGKTILEKYKVLKR